MTVNGKVRKDMHVGLTVEIIQKKDRSTGETTVGVIKDILTKSPQHPYGIKVRLQTGEVGRVQRIFE
jgi:uncharacterized repeat protein (TIGR03833 family)